MTQRKDDRFGYSVHGLIFGASKAPMLSIANLQRDVTSLHELAERAMLRPRIGIVLSIRANPDHGRSRGPYPQSVRSWPSVR